MTANPLSLGPWSGIDNKHHHTHPVFQLREEGATALTAAMDVMLNDEGWIEVRPGTTSRVTTTAGKNVFSALGLLLLQDGGTIKLVDPADWSESDLVPGLTASLRIDFIEHAGKIFYSNGTEHGIITAAGTATNWGLTVPPSPTLDTTAGDLPAGRYRVACTLVDANGVMSGAPAATTVSLDGTKDITVDLTSADANTVYVRVFASHTNTADLYYVGQVAVGSLPVTITDTNQSNELLFTQYVGGPQQLPGITGIGSWEGFVLVWRDTRVAHSVLGSHHLFDLRKAVWKLPHTVVAVAGSSEYCWVATERGLYRYSGLPGSSDIRSAFDREPMDKRKYAAGSLVLAESKIPALTAASGKVVVFASEDGIVFAQPTGLIEVPYMGRVRWDVKGKTASFCYRENGDFNNILVNLE